MSVIVHIMSNSSVPEDAWNNVLHACAAFTPNIEPFNSFEVFADLSGTPRMEHALRHLFTRFHHTQSQEHSPRLTATVAPTKFVARIGSLVLQQKPNSAVSQQKQRVANTTYLQIDHEHVADFLAPLPVHYLWHVQHGVHRRLNRLGLFNFYALQRVPRTMLTKEFGFRLGNQLSSLAYGHDEQPVLALFPQSTVTAEISYSADDVVVNYATLANTIRTLADTLATRLQTSGYTCCCIQLHITTRQHHTMQRSKWLHQATWHASALQDAALALFKQMSLPDVPLHVQLAAAHLTPPLTEQPLLFATPQQKIKQRHKYVLTYVRNRLGTEAIQFATALKPSRRERMRAFWQGM